MTETGLTERQAEVLRLRAENLNPTEIGRALGISSQGVHSHLRKLRELGAIEPAERPAKPNARRAPRPAPSTAVSATGALEAVRRAIVEQERAILARREAIQHEQAALAAEDTELEAALVELRQLVNEPPKP